MTNGHSGPPAPSVSPTGERLDGWKEIAVYLERDPRTVQRWEKKEGLPVHRHLHDKAGTVYAYKHEIDEWWQRRRLTLEAEIVPPEESGELEPAPPTAADIPAPGRRPPSQRDKILLGAAVLAVLLLVAYGIRGILNSGAPSTPEKTRLAVLPFENMSGDATQDFFSTGLTDELITALSQLNPNLGVIAWTTVKNIQAKTVEDICRELDLTYVLEGTVRADAENMRITVQLIQCSDQTHVLSQAYDRPIAHMIATQIELARDVAGKINIELLPTLQLSRSMRSPRPVNPEAYRAYLQGRYYWDRRAPQDLMRSIDFYQRAIRIDPRFAAAYSGLADTYNVLGFFNILASAEAYSKSKEAAQQALKIDENFADAHTSLADALYHYDYDWAGAEREFKRAIELNPRYATAHHWYAVLLALVGRIDEARTEIRQAQEADPHSLVISTDVALIHFYAAEYDKVIEQCRLTLRQDPNFSLAHMWLARAYVQKKMYAEGVAEFENAIQVQPGNVTVLALLGHAYGISGRAADARRVLAQLQQFSGKVAVSPALPALVYVGLGDNSRAMDLAQQAYNERAGILTRLQADPILDGLRGDPRYQDLLRRIFPAAKAQPPRPRPAAAGPPA